MKVKMSDDTVHDVYLEDDGTMDTVISVDGKDYRFDGEGAAYWRDPQTGAMSDEGIIELGRDAYDNDFE